MIALDDHSFTDTIDANPMVLVLFHPGDADGAARLAERLRDPDRSDGRTDERSDGPSDGAAAAGPWLWAHVDTTRAGETARMFGIDPDSPTLLIMREKIVLYLGQLDQNVVADIRVLIDRAARLDMARVRADIAEQHRQRMALEARRACPTTWRGTAD